MILKIIIFDWKSAKTVKCFQTLSYLLWLYLHFSFFLQHNAHASTGIFWPMTRRPPSFKAQMSLFNRALGTKIIFKNLILCQIICSDNFCFQMQTLLNEGWSAAVVAVLKNHAFAPTPPSLLPALIAAELGRRGRRELKCLAPFFHPSQPGRLPPLSALSLRFSFMFLFHFLKLLRRRRFHRTFVPLD